MTGQSTWNRGRNRAILLPQLELDMDHKNEQVSAINSNLDKHAKGDIFNSLRLPKEKTMSVKESSSQTHSKNSG